MGRVEEKKIPPQDAMVTHLYITLYISAPASQWHVHDAARWWEEKKSRTKGNLKYDGSVVHPYDRFFSSSSLPHNIPPSQTESIPSFFTMEASYCMHTCTHKAFSSSSIPLLCVTLTG